MTIARILAAAIILCLATRSTAFAETPFRKEFIEFYQRNSFDNLARFVKTKKQALPAEVRSLIKEAKSPDKTFEERMDLLDLANIMASMYKYWHNDPSLLAEVEPIMRSEIKKENERVAELEKWQNYEKFVGNFVMKEHTAEMDVGGVAPVIFPHWIHRLWYGCGACHDNASSMKRQSVSHAAMLDGKECGRCHDGMIAFSTGKECERCHVTGTPGEGRLSGVGKLDLKHVNEVAARLGSGFVIEEIKEGVMPADRFGFIDWGWLKMSGVLKPLRHNGETRDNKILFEPSMQGIKNVIFDHRTHSEEIMCSGCHQDIFKDGLGANRVSMPDMAEGRWCGYCHGKVAFNFADCNRCHDTPREEPVKGVLVRKKAPDK